MDIYIYIPKQFLCLNEDISTSQREDVYEGENHSHVTEVVVDKNMKLMTSCISRIGIHLPQKINKK